MSNRASAYAKELIVCPSGELISRGEKLVLIVLADAHQVRKDRFTYPSLDTIAPEALCDRRTCQRHLAGLERKGVIVRLRPRSQGRGMQVFYFFTALDDIPDQEGWQNAALLGGPEIGEEGRQKGGKRAAFQTCGELCAHGRKGVKMSPFPGACYEYRFDGSGVDFGTQGPHAGRGVGLLGQLR